MDSAYLAILLDIKEQNGALGAQMHEAARTRERLENRMKEVSQKMDMIDHRTDIIEARQAEIIEVTADIKPMKRDVEKLKLLTGKFTAVWGAGFAVIAWALSYFSNEIHSFIFGRHP